MKEALKDANQKVIVFCNERPIEAFFISFAISYALGRMLRPRFG
jgi:hypothetical protein